MEEEYQYEEPSHEVNVMGIVSLVLAIIGLLTIPCFGLGGLICLVAIALGFASFKRGTQKGFGIASIAISFAGILAGLIFAVIVFLGGSGIVAPQYLKYVTKVNAANDQMLCNDVCVAMQVVAAEICTEGNEATLIGSLADDQYHDITKIPSGEFKKRIEDCLGKTLIDAQKEIKGVQKMYFKIDSNYYVTTQLK